MLFKQKKSVEVDVATGAASETTAATQTAAQTGREAAAAADAPPPVFPPKSPATPLITTPLLASGAPPPQKFTRFERTDRKLPLGQDEIIVTWGVTKVGVGIHFARESFRPRGRFWA